MTRRIGGRSQSRTMLILTEGESEVRYFGMFKGRDHHVAIVPIVAKRHDSKNLVPFCVSKVLERGIDVDNGDTVSVVIDMDQRPPSEIKDIESQCMEHGFNLYLFNISFEYWLILHFSNWTRASTQDELEEELSKHLGCKYIKSEGINNKIETSSIDSAIRYAEARISDQSKRNEICSGLDPSTTVHFLVKDIRVKIEQ